MGPHENHLPSNVTFHGLADTDSSGHHHSDTQLDVAE